MNTNSDNNTRTRLFLKHLVTFLRSPKAGSKLPAIFFVVLIILPVLKTAMTFLPPYDVQISGYYIGTLEYGLLLMLVLTWLLSIVLLFLDHQFNRGVRRILAIPILFLIGGFISLFCCFFLPSMISGWPIDTIYSQNRDKYYVLAYEPALTDVCYRVFSTKTTLLHPCWTVEFAGNVLDYSEDGSLVKNPHLILSADEELLAIERGGHLTDAILIDSAVPLVEYVSCFDGNREKQWERRTSQIRSLLKQHSLMCSTSRHPLSTAGIKDVLLQFYKRLSEQLTASLADDGWSVSCYVSEINQDGVRIHVRYAVECSKAGEKTTFPFPRNTTLVDDHGRLIVIEQDRGLSWSGDEEKVLAERLRDLIVDIAGSGTYIN